MDKEQQIIEWFEKNKDFYTDVPLSIKADYRAFCTFVDATTIFNTNNGNIITPYCAWVANRVLNYVKKYLKNGCDDIFLGVLKETLIKKNRDYGNSFDKSIKKFGWIYLAIELDKKKNRLHSLLKSKEKPNYESIEDTLLDIAGYCVLALIYIKNNKRVNV